MAPSTSSLRQYITTTEAIVKPRLIKAFASVAAIWTVLATIALIITSPIDNESLTSNITGQGTQASTPIFLIIISATGAIALLFASSGSRILLAPIAWIIALAYATLIVQVLASNRIWYLPPLALLLTASFISTSIYATVRSNRAKLFQLFAAALAAIVGFYLIRWQFTNVLIAIERETDRIPGTDKTLLMAYGSAAAFTFLGIFLAGGVVATFLNAVSNSRRAVLVTGGFTGCLMLGSIIGLSFGGWLMIPSTLLMGLATLISNSRES